MCRQNSSPTRVCLSQTNQKRQGCPQLTPRQEEVLHLLLDGRSNKDISRILQLSDETTKNHVTRDSAGLWCADPHPGRSRGPLYGYTKSAPSA